MEAALAPLSYAPALTFSVSAKVGEGQKRKIMRKLTLFFTFVFTVVTVIINQSPYSTVTAQSDINLGGIRAFDLSVDGRLLVTGHTNHTVRIWNTATQQVLVTVATSNFVPTSSISNDTNYLINSVLQDIAISPDNSKVAVSFSGDTYAGMIRIFDVSSGQLISEILAGTQVFDLAWKPDSSQIAAKYVLGGYLLGIWGTNFQPIVQIPISFSVIGLAWKPDGTQLAADTGNIIIWSTSTWQPVLTIENPDQGGSRISWRHDGSQLASVGGDGSVYIFDSSTGQQIHTLLGNWQQPRRLELSWSLDDNYIAVPLQGAQIQVWNTTTGLEAFRVETGVPVSKVAWAPNGDVLYATGSFTSVQVAQTPISQPTATPGATNTETAIPTFTAATTSTGTAILTPILNETPNP